MKVRFAFFNGSLFEEDYTPKGTIISEGVEKNTRISWLNSGILSIDKHGNPKIDYASRFKKNKGIEFAIQSFPLLVYDRRIRVSNNSLEYALIGTGFPTYNMDILEQYVQVFKEISLKTSGQRRMGSAALDLAYVATGYLDGFWEFNLKSWDVAAGVLLVKESGGIVSDFRGNSHNGADGNIIAANSKIITQLQKIINLEA
jgi:hypothetical protein